MFAERDLWIAADARRIREAREWAAEAALEFGLEHDERYEVKLAMSEIVANAIQHGSGGPEDRIRISARAHERALVFEVLDTGVFRRAGAAAGVSERGRGLDLVGLMMDELELTSRDEGTLMRFAKRR